MKKKEIEEYINSKTVTQDNYVAPTVSTHVDTRKPVVTPTINYTQTQKNLRDAVKNRDVALSNYRQALSNELKKNNVDYRTKFNNIYGNQISYQTKEQDRKNTQAKPTIIPIAEANKNLQKEIEANNKAYDAWKLANYENNLAKVQNEKTSFFDKTLGVPLRALADYVSPLTTGTDSIIKDEQGNKTFLPSYSEIKQEKVKEDYNSNLARGLSDILYGGTKILASTATDLATGGIGGKSLYWTDMATDNYKNLKNQGYTNEQAGANTIISTASEFLTEKLLGGVSGKLTGKFGLKGAKGLEKSGLDDLITNQVSKFIQNPTIASLIGSMGSEGLEEFTQEFIGAINNKLTLGEDTNIEDLVKDALYSGIIGAGTAGLVNTTLLPGTIQNTNINQNLANQQIDTTQEAIQTQPIRQEIETPVQESTQTNTNTNAEQKTSETGLNEVKNLPFEENTQRRSSILDKLSTDERQSLRNIFAKQVNNETLSQEDLNQLEYLRRKANNIKNPELKTNNTFNDLKSDYGKYYKNATLDDFDSTMLEKAENTISANKQGKRTKAEWLDVAKNIGLQADNMNSEELKRYAFESFKSAAPNQSTNLNRQGQKYVKFGIDEWVNSVYEGAGVGKQLESKQSTSDNIPAKVEKEPVLKVETTGEKGKQYFENKGASSDVAKILSETPRERQAKLSLKEKAEKAVSDIKQNVKEIRRAFVDKGQEIYDLGKHNKQLYPSYDFMALSESAGQYQIGNAQTNNEGKAYKNFKDKNGKQVSMSLKGIWNEVDSAGLNNIMDEYLAHQLNTDVYGRTTATSQNEIDEIMKQAEIGFISFEEAQEMTDASKRIQNVFGENVTKEDSLKRIKEIEQQYPGIKNLANNIWQYGYNMLDNMVDSGLVSKKQAEEFKKENPHYVRLQRNVENKSIAENFDGIDLSKEGVKVRSGIQERKGGTQDILPFRDTMADYTRYIMRQSRLNQFSKNLGTTLNTYIDSDSSQIDTSGITYGDQIQENKDGTYTLRYYEDGKPKQLLIDKGIYDALQPNKKYQFEDWLPFKITGKASKIQRDLITGKNILFSTTNAPKDLFNAVFNTKNSIPKFFANYVKAIPEVITNGETYQQYKALGGNQNTYYNYEEGYVKDKSKIKALKAGKAIIKGIEKINNFVETLPRLAEFKTSLDNGKSVQEAMYNAAEVTTNFKRGGNVTKAVDRVGANYFNPSVQGASKFVRNFSEAIENKQYAKILTRVALLGLTPALVGEIMWGDDDEYTQLPEYQKDNYYLFKSGNGNWIRIPKGQVQGALQSLPRRAISAVRGQKNAFSGFGDTIANNVAPNNPLTDNVLGPIISAKENKAWSGNQIVPSYLENPTYPSEEYTSGTDEFSKWLGKKTNTSPAKINYLLDQYTGVLGDVALPMMTKKTTTGDNNILNPLKSKFSTNVAYSNKSQSEFYEALNRAEDGKKKRDPNLEDSVKYKYLSSVQKDMADLNRKAEEIQSSNKSSKQKYKEVTKIKNQINEMARNAVKKAESVEKEDNYMKIENNYYYKIVEDGKIKYQKATAKQIEKNKYALSDYFQEMYEKSKEKDKESD